MLRNAILAVLLSSAPIVSERPSGLGTPERSAERYTWCPEAPQVAGVRVLVVTSGWPAAQADSPVEVRKSSGVVTKVRTGEDGRVFVALEPGSDYLIQATASLCPSKVVKVHVRKGCVSEVGLVLPGAIKRCGCPCKSK